MALNVGPTLTGTDLSSNNNSFVGRFQDVADYTHRPYVHTVLKPLELGVAELPKRCRCLVIRERYLFRKCWGVVVALLLFYMATVGVYRLCFVELGFESSEQTAGWAAVEQVVNALFITDLLLNFFMSYKDHGSGLEVRDLPLCAKNYLTGYFVLDLLACLPWSQMSGQGSKDRVLNTAFRIVRIQRIWRLTRLAKLKPIVQFLSDNCLQNAVMSHILHSRGWRLLTLLVGVMLVVHLLACGWFLCAALHDRPEATWVGRRVVVDGADGLPLTERPPLVHWMHAVYFVLTVFTTVGFGDISAETPAEIVYACTVMVVGCIINATVMGHVLSILTGVDRLEEAVRDQQRVVQDFGSHTELDAKTQELLQKWASRAASSQSGFQRDKMRQLLDLNAIPLAALELLPGKLFNGRLLANSFLRHTQMRASEMPPRLPVLLAIALTPMELRGSEVVYCMYEMPQHLYLVQRGLFADVALPQPEGGVDCAAVQLLDHGHRSRKHVMVRILSQSEASTGSNCEPTKTTQRRANAELFGYRIFGRNSYFGEFELLVNTMRRSSTRCESASGSLLALSKLDLEHIVAEFPKTLHKWRLHAFRREHARERLVQELRKPISVPYLAACWLQRAFRQLLRGESLSSLKTWRGGPGARCQKVSFLSLAGGAARASVACSSEDPRPEVRPPEAPGVLEEVRSLRGEVDALRADVRLLLQALHLGQDVRRPGPAAGVGTVETVVVHEARDAAGSAEASPRCCLSLRAPPAQL